MFDSFQSDQTIKKSVILFTPGMPPSPWQIGLKDKSVMHSDLEIVVAYKEKFCPQSQFMNF